MANIGSVFAFLRLEDMDRMAPHELMRWHEKAIARSKKG